MPHFSVREGPNSCSASTSVTGALAPDDPDFISAMGSSDGGLVCADQHFVGGDCGVCNDQVVDDEIIAGEDELLQQIDQARTFFAGCLSFCGAVTDNQSKSNEDKPVFEILPQISFLNNSLTKR